MVSALLMFRRLAPAFRYAVREEEFLRCSARGPLGAGWNVVDAPYFAKATLTTTSVADPDLILEDGWLKLFTVLYQLVGIGILVEILRRLGLVFVEVRKQERGSPPAQHS